MESSWRAVGEQLESSWKAVLAWREQHRKSRRVETDWLEESWSEAVEVKRMVREEMVFRSGQILPTVMETMDEQGDTGSQEGMEIELPDEGVESQEETESQDETESQEEAESQEETKSQDEMEPQMETPDNLHWNWADEVEEMVDRQIDKKLELWEKCCGEARQVKQICCRCQRAGHRARECNAKKTLDGVELPISGEQRKQASLVEAGGHLVGGQDTGEYSTGGTEVLGGVRTPTSSLYPPGRGPTKERLSAGGWLAVNRGRLSRSAGAAPRRPLGSRNMEKNSYGSGKKAKCYRCKRTGHFARECFARKTLDGQELPLPRPKGGINRMKEEPGSEVVHTDSE